MSRVRVQSYFQEVLLQIVKPIRWKQRKTELMLSLYED